jgi:hypothetical protein
MLQEMALRPLTAVRSIMNSNDISLAAVLIAGILAVRILAYSVWWQITPHAVFGFKSGLISWAGSLLYMGSWAGALTFFASRGETRTEFIRVLTGVAAVWVIPTLASAIMTMTPGSLRTAAGVLGAVDAIFTYVGLFSIARVLSPDDDATAFRTTLYSGLVASAVSIIWHAIF